MPIPTRRPILEFPTAHSLNVTRRPSGRRRMRMRTRNERTGTSTRQSTWRLFLVTTPTPPDPLQLPLPLVSWPLHASNPTREEGSVLCRNSIPGPRGTDLFPALNFYPMEQVTVPVLVYLIMIHHHQRLFQGSYSADLYSH
jgi:hypothetical protein